MPVEAQRPRIGEKLEDFAYQHLCTKILRGELAPGSRINERTLSGQLAISRAPVRQAMKRLETEGFLQTVPRCGTFVREMSVREYLDMFDVRMAIEVCAVRSAVSAMSEMALEALRRLAQSFHDAIDLPMEESKAMVRYRDILFHTYVLEHCGNSILARVIRPIFPTLTSYFGYAWPDTPKQHDRVREVTDVVRLHHAYVDVLAARDPDRAEAEVRAHIDGKRKEFQEMIAAGIVDLTQDAAAGFDPLSELSGVDLSFLGRA